MGDEIITTKVDNEGKIAIPKEIRENIGVSEGDVFFINFNSKSISLTKAAENPLAKLKDFAINEYQQGNTISLEEYCKQEGLDYE